MGALLVGFALHCAPDTLPTGDDPVDAAADATTPPPDLPPRTDSGAPSPGPTASLVGDPRHGQHDVLRARLRRSRRTEYGCPLADCGMANQQHLATLTSGALGLGANSSGVFAVGGGLPSKLLRCPGDVCTTESLSFFPVAFAVSESSLAFARNAAAAGVDVGVCPLTGCGAGPFVIASCVQSTPWASSRGLFFTPGAVSPAWASSVSCPVTGCGTNPPVGTEWVTLWTTSEVATSASTVFVHGLTRLEACPLSGCAPGPFIAASGLGRPDDGSASGVTPWLATDGLSLYFFDLGSVAPWVPALGMRLLKCPVGGCDASGPEVLWSSPKAPSPTPFQTSVAIALSDTSVYFTALQADGSSALVTVPK